MPHHPLIATIVIGIVLAFVLGAIANRLRISPLVGYLLAGVVVGPYTPGFVADGALALQLAEIGVILLMFGVGLHFSLKDLIAVQSIAVPAALIQILFVLPLAMALTWAMGWRLGAGVVFGVALAVASTVVLMRTLGERHLLDTERGRVAVGWLIVEDIVMVVALVLLPPLAALLSDGSDPDPVRLAEILLALGITLIKIAVFIALMLLVGRRFIPWVLHQIAHTGSRELFRLAVLAIALGVAYGSAALFDVSFALGAFFAGMVMSESQLSQQAAEQTLPLRDAFAVLFFVSVGMLFDPLILVEEIGPLIATLAIILVAKPVVSFLLMAMYRMSAAGVLTIAAGRAQVGEFSFIIMTLGVELELLPPQGRDLVLAGAVISICLNPLAFIVVERLRPWLERHPRFRPTEPQAEAAPEVVDHLPVTSLTGHAVLIGYGRVGSVIGEACLARGEKLLVIETAEPIVERLRACAIEVVPGPGEPADLLRAANIAAARILFVAIPNSFEAGQFVEQARAANPSLAIVARAHSDAEVEYLLKLGADETVLGETEIATAMIARAFAGAPATPIE